MIMLFLLMLFFVLAPTVYGQDRVESPKDTAALESFFISDDDSWDRRMLKPGVEHFQQHFKDDNGIPRFINLVAIDLDESDVEVKVTASYVFGGKPHRMAISEYGEKSEALVAINAGFAGRSSSDYYNSGILRIAGEDIPYHDDAPEEITRFVGSAAVGIDYDKKWHFVERPGENWNRWDEVEFAIAGGHMLLAGGVMKENIRNGEGSTAIEIRHINSTHPRTAICKTNKNIVVFIVVDGRHDQATGMPLNELAQFMLGLGCEDAINFDGGGSSTMWINDGGVVNHPSDNKIFDNKGQRRVKSAIIVK
ncbi:MAG: phosphodiester glycosidase family protein [Balneolaceae bacterium]